jgi:ATP-dependent DNA ligase
VRSGNDLTRRFPLIVDARARLRSRSSIIYGEAVACDNPTHRAEDRSRRAQPLPSPDALWACGA